MRGGILTFDSYLRWVSRKQPNHKVSVQAWCMDRLDCKSVTVHSKEIRCTFRNAWTDTYVPDELLNAFLTQVQRQLTASETLNIRFCPAIKGTSRHLKAFTIAEECQWCSRCPDCCNCEEQELTHNG